jgi:hypothetical protein
MSSWTSYYEKVSHEESVVSHDLVRKCRNSVSRFIFNFAWLFVSTIAKDTTLPHYNHKFKRFTPVINFGQNKMVRLSKHIESKHPTMVRRLVPDDSSVGSDSNHSNRSTISVNTKKRFKNAMESMKSINFSGSSRKRPQRKEVQPSKSVCFAPTAQIFFTLNIDEYSEAERVACWFERSDYEQILEKCHKVVRKCKTWTSEAKNSKLCTRGLERMTKMGNEVARYNRVDAYDAVLSQRGEPSPEMIARLYSGVTIRSKKRALRLAEGDAASALRYIGSS